MNQNQPPNYPPGSVGGGNPPSYPPQGPPVVGPGGPPSGTYPPPVVPPGAGFPHYPIYQAGMPHPYMPPTTPQYPQPGVGGVGGGAGVGGPAGIPPNFMNVQIKPEPVWNQDTRYGMPGTSAGGMPGGGQGYGGYPPMAMMDNTGAPTLPALYSPAPPTPGPPSQPPQQPIPPQQQHHNPSQSLLAQHLSSAPLPPSSSSASMPGPSVAHQMPPHPSHLSQLLGQPMYPGLPTPQQMQMQQQLTPEQYQQKMQALQALQAHRHYNAQMEMQQLQQQQQTRAAKLQAEQEAMAAAAAQAAQAASQAPPPGTQVLYPPSASSSHSAYSAANRAQNPEVVLAHQTMPLTMVRESPHQKDIDLEKFTTGELCQYGRELVNELNGKTSILSYMLKKVMERKTLNQGENPEELAEHCTYNMAKMSEIRQIIEKRRDSNWKRLTGDEYIELMLDDSELTKPIDAKRAAKRAELEQRFPAVMSRTQPNEGDVWYQGRWIPEALHKKYLKFDANKAQLTLLATQLKNLSWKIDVTSPSHLKKVDQTKISKRKNNEDPNA